MEIKMGPVKKRTGIDMELFTTQYHKVGPKNNQCWNWIGPFYGPASFTPLSTNAKTPANRWIFETMIGSLPERVVLMPDEHCTLSNEIPKGFKKPERGHCVNPEHYYAMTPLDAYRLDWPDGKDECANGHPYTQNSVTYSVQNRQLICRICAGKYIPDPRPKAKPEPKKPEPQVEVEVNLSDAPADISEKWMVKPDGPPREYTNAEFDKFMEQTEVKGPKDCLVWTGNIGTTSTGGVPQPLFFLGKASYRAYRWLFEVTYGTLPSSTILMVESDCEEFCVHADHRIPVTRSYYSSHRPTPRKRTECNNGHPYVEGSYRITDRGYRQCLICDQEYKAKRKKQREAARWIKWSQADSQDELNVLVWDMDDKDYRDLQAQLEDWADQELGEDQAKAYSVLTEAVQLRRAKEAPAEPEPTQYWLNAALDQDQPKKEVTMVLNPETQVDPNAVFHRPVVANLWEHGLRSVDGIYAKIPIDEISAHFHLDGLPDEEISSVLNRIEDRGKFLAPHLWETPDPDPIVDGGYTGPVELDDQNLIDWRAEQEQLEQDELDTREFLRALDEIHNSQQMVALKIRADLPLDVSGSVMLQIMNALSSAGATNVRLG